MSQAVPHDRSYTDDHEWIMITPGAPLPDEPVRVGITSAAVDALGDLVFVDLPEVGSLLEFGQPCGEIESTKTVSELVAPVSGRVTLTNTAVVDDPTIISADPYAAGWLYAVQPTAAGPLLTAAEYAGQGADNA